MPFGGDQIGHDLVSHLAQDEMDSIIEEWDRYDVDQSGVVTEQEFLKGEQAWYERVYGEAISEEELKEKLVFWERTKDADGSGEVSWNEFAESKALLIMDQRGALKDCLSPEEVNDARMAFTSIDADGSGTITQSEARRYFEKRADIDVKNGLRTQKAAMHHVEKQIKTMFMFKDEDGNGMVDFDEFLSEEAKNIIADRYNTDKQALQAVPVEGNVVGGEGDEAAFALTDDQVEHARMKFADWDKNGNGTLEIKELQSITKELNLKTTAKEFRSAIKKEFKKRDVDGSGGLTFEEFLPVYNLLYIGDMDFSASC